MPLRTAEGTFSSSDNANNTLMVWNPATIHELTTTVEQIVLPNESTLSPDDGPAVRGRNAAFNISVTIVRETINETLYTH